MKIIIGLFSKTFVFYMKLKISLKMFMKKSVLDILSSLLQIHLPLLHRALFPWGCPPDEQQPLGPFTLDAANESQWQQNEE